MTTLSSTSLRPRCAVLPWRLAIPTALVVSALVVPMATAGAAAAVAAPPAAEAWYRVIGIDLPPLEVCGLPVLGCAPLPEITVPSQYPAGTLHVGLAAGEEESRTYLSLDNSKVPFGTDVTGGTLTLPVAGDTEAGSVLPETAVFKACLGMEAVEDGVEGEFAGVPPIDCGVSSEAAYEAGEDGAAGSFTIDLAPFAELFATGSPVLALVGTESPGATWHVAFSQRDREVEGARPITAQLQLAPSADDRGAVPDGEALGTDTGPVDTGSANGPLLPGGAFEFPVDESGAPAIGAPVTMDPSLSTPVPPAVANPTVPNLAATEPVSLTTDGRFRQPVVFLLPLLLAGGVAWVARAFTRELAPVGT